MESSVTVATDVFRVAAVNGSLAMNGEPVDDIPAVGEWTCEPKWDGWRLITIVGDGKVDFFARSGKSYNGKLPHVEAELLAHFPAGTVLDGEAVALKPRADGTIENVWGTAQSALSGGLNTVAAKLVTYMVFDLIAHRGIDARSLPFAKRRGLLEKAFDEKGMVAVRLTPSYPATAELHAQMVRTGFEGSMVKRLDAPYASGKRGHGLCKWKHRATEDLVVMGFEPGRDVGAVVLGQFRDGKLVQRATAKRKPTLIPTPDLMEWANRVVEVEHNGVFPGGALRHPRMLRVRDDKAAEQCVWP